MFTQVCEAFVNHANNKANNKAEEPAEKKPVNMVLVLVLALLLQLLINALVGQWLWNNSVRKLVPSFGKARWWDTIALAVLLMIVVPH